MILELYIKNFALISELRIEFDKGLNVITGETGSGKSIMIDALSLALGKKGSKAVVKSGEEKAIVEAVFFSEKNEIFNLLKDQEIDFDDNIIILTREINKEGRSISRINGRTVTQSDLKRVTSQLITIHGQNEYEQLLTSTNQLQIIDNFGGEKILNVLENHQKNFEDFLSIESQILRLNDYLDSEKIERELSQIKYEIAEIEDAKFIKNEREQIKDQLLKIENAEKITSNLDFVYQSLYGESQSILDILSKCITKLEEVNGYDSQISKWSESVNDAFYSLEDIAHEINNAAQLIEDNYDHLDTLNQRLDQLNQLHRKYGQTYEDVMAYKENILSREEEILTKDEKTLELKKRLSAIENELSSLSNVLTNLRKRIAELLLQEIKIEIESLNMKNVKMMIEFEKSKLNRSGADHVDFLVSFNKGEELKPFSKIASGGEVSRFMLAFKTVVAKSDDIETLIFDEIDTGVSGISAQKIGEKLREISKFRQVLCITHLPQIASFANTHFMVEKYQDTNRTATNVKKLNLEGRISEIAKMMSGSNITASTLETASGLIERNSKE